MVGEITNKKIKKPDQNKKEIKDKDNVENIKETKDNKMSSKKDKKTSDKAGEKAANKESKKKNIFIISIFIIIIFVVLFGAFEYEYNTNSLYLTSTANFSTFESNFNSAPNVSIVISASNGTELSYAINCGVSLIRTLTSSHINHKAPSEINLYVMNNVNCTYQKGLGVVSGNYITTTPAECLNMINTPAIFINYSNVNQTIIKPYDLYFSGNAKFLQICGISPEITSGS
ncbi:MAG: hypothetical protein ACP5UN_02470 [Candidatus Micrarchaeia archaeon]